MSLTSLKFLASCVLVVADHFTWFFHFAQRAQEQKKWKGPKYRYGASSVSGGGKGSGYAAGEETFMDIAAFFGVCVWFVPLFLFLSLSANDNALPSLSESISSSISSSAHCSALPLPLPPGGKGSQWSTPKSIPLPFLCPFLCPFL